MLRNRWSIRIDSPPRRLLALNVPGWFREAGFLEWLNAPASATWHPKGGGAGSGSDAFVYFTWNGPDNPMRPGGPSLEPIERVECSDWPGPSADGLTPPLPEGLVRELAELFASEEKLNKISWAGSRIEFDPDGHWEGILWFRNLL